VYAGGQFTSIGGASRNKIAAIDAASGLATGWDPSAQGDFGVSDVYALAVSGSTVYAGGEFSAIGGQPRNRIAAIEALSGLATPAWNPGASGRVLALAISGTTVYAGGGFGDICGRPQSFIAAIGDVETPTLLSLVSAHAAPDRVELVWFAPARDVASATVYRRSEGDDWSDRGRISADGTGRLTFEDADVIAGTRYGYRLGVVASGAEEFLGESWVEVPAAAEMALAGFRSNPAGDDLSVEFSLPDGAPARLELFDVGGRRIASREVGTLGAGTHVVTFESERRPAPGVYLLRLSRGDRSLTTRGAILR
jgi:hypothetical protein